MTNPQLITTPFAENGTKNTIPESGSAEPQLATMQAGFPEITQRPISDGGIPPDRADFNGILNMYGQHIVHLNKGLAYEFDQDFADKIGGYPLNARIMLSSGEVVQNTQEGNTNNPNISMGGWKSSAVSKDVTIPTYKTAADGVNPVTGVADGAYFNVRSEDDDTVAIEYQNVGGSAVATGKSYLSALGVQQQEKSASTIKDASGKDQQELNDFATLNVFRFFTKQELIDYLANSTTFDASDAIQRALFAAGNLKRNLVAYGEFYCSKTVIFLGAADFSQAKIYTDATDIAIDVRAIDYTYLRDATIKLPELINKNKVDGDQWVNTMAIGVRTVNLDSCTIHTGHIWNFAINFQVLATNGRGNCYSTYFVEHLQNGKINLDIQAEVGSWANENLFIGGRYSHLTAEGVLVSGVRHVRIGAGVEYVPNQNEFFKASLEGRIAEYVAEVSGNYNYFDRCRWESNTLPRILYKKFTEMSTAASQATRNVISGGYQGDSIQVVNEGSGGAFANTLESSFRRNMVMQGSDVGFKLKNVSSDQNPIIRLYAPTDTDDSNPTMTITSRQIGGRRFSDSFDRVSLDFYNSRLYLGNGTAQPTNYLQGGSTSILSSTSINPITTDALSLGSNTLRWKNLSLSGAIGLFGATAPETKPSITGKITPTTIAELAEIQNSVILALTAFGLVSDARN